MTTVLFTNAELICFDHDIIKIIKKIKKQHQRADINSIHKKFIKIPDYHDVSKELLNIRIENLLKKWENKSNKGNPLFTLNGVTIEIPVHDGSYSVLHVETTSTEYNLQTPNRGPIVSTIPETQELIANMVNDFSFTEATSPEDELLSFWVFILSVICSRWQYLKTSYCLIVWKKKQNFKKFRKFKNNIISDLTKIINEKIKTELKTFKTESLKELSESLTWHRNETKALREEGKSKYMIIARLSKTIENLTNKNLK